MKNMKLMILFLTAVLVGLFLFVQAPSKKPSSQQSKPTVAVTTFALHDIVEHIAQDSVRIIQVLPYGVDPHSFEPTPKLMAAIEKSSLFIYSGAGLEPWVHGFTFHSPVLNISKYVHLRHLDADEHELHDHHDHQCAHNTTDPHYWLDFKNMQTATKVITEALIKLQPKYKKMYKANEKKYIAMLQNLQKLYRENLRECRLHTVVTSHNALGYLAEAYGFDVESLSGLSPEAQPSAKDVERIMKQVKEKGVGTIFFENFVNESVIRRIAADTGIELEVFDALGTITKDEAAAGMDYEKMMKKNLQRLKKALECK